jgi:toxin ParE1/3/4
VLSITESAQSELGAAADFYGAFQIAFLEAVLESYQLIERFPRLAPAIDGTEDLGEVRAFLMTRFPHQIVYLVEGDDLMVLAFAHTSRRPGYWRERPEPEA